MKLATEFRYKVGDPVYLDVGDYKTVPAWVISAEVGHDGKPFYGITFDKHDMPWGDTLAREDQLVSRSVNVGEVPRPHYRQSAKPEYPHLRWDKKEQRWVAVIDGEDATSFESVQQGANYVQHHSTRLIT